MSYVILNKNMTSGNNIFIYQGRFFIQNNNILDFFITYNKNIFTLFTVISICNRDSDMFILLILNSNIFKLVTYNRLFINNIKKRIQFPYW